MGSFILMRYTGCMGWLRNLIFGEPNDEYLARISSIKSIGDSSRAGGMGLPQEGAVLRVNRMKRRRLASRNLISTTWLAVKK